MSLEINMKEALGTYLGPKDGEVQNSGDIFGWNVH